MTGFIRGLFGGNRKPRAPKPPKQRGAFFLDEDEAKTFGDIDYMRSSKVVKRTFARKKGQTEEMETVRQISAMQRQDVDENGLVKRQPMNNASSMQSSTPSFESASKPAEAPKFERRKAASNDMDMFRNMARDIKKR